MKFIRYADLPVKALIRNPKNPRQDLGDLSELTESIAQNGIYQELTVVPHGQNLVDGVYIDAYMVIIGHRRLAAARAAGLATVPCRVVEMSAQEQQTTMLTENVQRSDLTPLEEAKGIQMCLDLGIPESEISEKAGMSKAKIRSRKILLQYDDNFVKGTFAKGMTIQDYVDAEKVKDEKRRSELILNYGGTSDFRIKLEAEISKQNAKKVKDMILEKIAPYAEPLPKGTDEWKLNYIYYFHLSDAKPEDVDKVIREKLLPIYSQKKIYYIMNSYGIFIKREPDPEQKPEKSAEVQEAEDNKKKLEHDLELALKCRINFVKDLKNYLPRNQHEAKKKVFIFVFDKLYRFWSGIALPKLIESEFFANAEDKEEFLANIYDQRPAYAAIVLEWLIRESSVARNSYLWGYMADYRPSSAEVYKELYAFLKQFNYEISTVEKQLIEGTHPNYQQPGEK